MDLEFLVQVQNLSRSEFSNLTREQIQSYLAIYCLKLKHPLHTSLTLSVLRHCYRNIHTTPLNRTGDAWRE